MTSVERMQPVVSVVTAVDPGRAEHLPDTWASLRDQAMPDGWSWEWLVQCDSTRSADQQAVRQYLPDDDRVSFAANRSSGPGIARNLALARAHGRLVKTLDADDRLSDGVLSRDIDAHSHRGVVWSASRVVNEHVDGQREDHFVWNPPPGRIHSGAAYQAYQHDYRILVHPATLCARFSTLLALGGWMALPASEDTALLLALDATADGWFHDEVGLVYRRWSPQMSQSREHADPYELDARRTLTKLRADAVHDLLAIQQ